METQLLFGFGETDITPLPPVLLYGYYYDRVATAIHDRLGARSMAVSDGERRVVLCVADLVRLTDEIVSETRQLVRRQCGLAPENLILSVIHTHTGPDILREKSYTAALPQRLAESIRIALEDMRPSELAVTRCVETTVQFIRRYRMKDGSVKTNPGILCPDVIEPIGTVDPELQVLLASDDGRTRGAVAHFALHCDTVGGTEISADWTHYLRRRLQMELGRDTPVLTPIGPCGDVNHLNVFADVPLRGFAETERIGNRIGNAAIAALRQPQPLQPGPVCGLRREICLRTRTPTESELSEARRILAQPAPEGVDFTMERVEARRRVLAAEAGPTLRVDIGVLAFGNVALVAIPAELFTELGRRIKAGSPFDHTLVVTLAHRSIMYVGAKHNYEEGGYEMVTSMVVPGAGEQMVDAALALLREAKERQECSTSA